MVGGKTEDRPASRRTVLKVLGGATTFGGVTGIVGADRQNVDSKTFIFRKASAQQNQPRTCSESGQFTKFGGGARLPPGTVPYELRGVPSQFRGAITNAFETWGNKTGEINFAQQPESKNFVAWDPLSQFPEAVLAVATIFFTRQRGPTIERFKIQFDSDDPWGLGGRDACFTEGTFFDVRGVATHEVGHVMGIGHSGAPSSTAHTMYPFAWPESTIKRTLAKGDLNGVNALY